MGKLSLIQMLQEIMDLDDPYDEAKRKLCKTYMIVNGIVVRVNHFDIDCNTIQYTGQLTGDNCVTKVETLKVWLPKTGLYQLSNGQLYHITKIPKRQWSKSFTQEYYHCELLGIKKPDGKHYRVSEQVYTEICEKSPTDIAVSWSGEIYYGHNVIGEIANSSGVNCFSTEYEQELIDWCKL